MKQGKIGVEDIPSEVLEAIGIEAVAKETGVGLELMKRYEDIKDKYPKWFPKIHIKPKDNE